MDFVYIDIDECADGAHVCMPGVQTCRNIIGSYECNCDQPDYVHTTDLITCELAGELKYAFCEFCCRPNWFNGVQQLYFCSQ